MNVSAIYHRLQPLVVLTEELRDHLNQKQIYPCARRTEALGRHPTFLSSSFEVDAPNDILDHGRISATQLCSVRSRSI